MIQNTAFRILSCFFSSDTRSFTDVCKQVGYPTDLGGYYLRQLANSGYVSKSGRGKYTITIKGKQQLAVSYGKQAFASRPRLSALLVASRGSQFAVLRRTRQPFIGVAEWPAGAIKIGEELTVGAARIARERFGFECKPVLRGFFRRIDTYKGVTFDDKLFAICTCDIPDGADIATSSKTGQTTLVEKTALKNISNPSKMLLDIFNYVQKGASSFQERTYELSPGDIEPPVDQESDEI